MAITKYEIYDYWKDKAITHTFALRRWAECREEDEAVPVVEFSDSICCWACGMPSLSLEKGEFAGGDDRKKDWNNAKSLQKAHIRAKSLGGLDTADNLFLLCPLCHAESPDTREKENFFAWVYYKRRQENYMITMQRELERACRMKNMDMSAVLEYLAETDSDKLMDLRGRVIKNCTVHGAAVAWSSKAMALLSEIRKDLLSEIRKDLCKIRKDQA